MGNACSREAKRGLTAMKPSGNSTSANNPGGTKSIQEDDQITDNDNQFLIGSNGNQQQSTSDNQIKRRPIGFEGIEQTSEVRQTLADSGSSDHRNESRSSKGSNSLSGGVAAVFMRLRQSTTEWRRIGFFLILAPFFLIIGAISLNLGITCYIGDLAKGDERTVRQLERKARCVVVEVDSIAVIMAVLGVGLLLLGVCCLAGAAVLYWAPPAEQDKTMSADIEERVSLLEDPHVSKHVKL